MNMHNPIHMDIFYTGFLNSPTLGPSGYNKILNANVEIDEVKYMRVISKIDDTILNKNKMVKEAAAEYILVENHTKRK